MFEQFIKWLGIRGVAVVLFLTVIVWLYYDLYAPDQEALNVQEIFGLLFLNLLIVISFQIIFTQLKAILSKK